MTDEETQKDDTVVDVTLLSTQTNDPKSKCVHLQLDANDSIRVLIPNDVKFDGEVYGLNLVTQGHYE